MDWLGSDIWVTWIALGVALCVLELTSAELIFLMLGAGAFAGAGAASLGAPIELQLAVFGIAATALVALVRPRIAAKVHDGPSLPSGNHGLVGKIALVAEPIDHLDGRVRIYDVLWTARPLDSAEHYSTGEEVVIVAIEGATAIVTRKENS